MSKRFASTVPGYVVSSVHIPPPEGPICGLKILLARLSPACFLWTWYPPVYTWSERHHVLVDAPAKQRVATQLICFSEPELCGQIGEASIEIGVLCIGSIAVCLMGVANPVCNSLAKLLHSFFLRCGSESGCTSVKVNCCTG